MKKRSFSTHFFADNWIFLLCLLSLILWVTAEFFFNISVFSRAFFLVLVAVGFYFSGFLHQKRTGDSKFFKKMLFLLFFLYLYLLINLTLLDNSLGRQHFAGAREEYIYWRVNLIPLKSIYETYIKGYLAGYIGLFTSIVNLLGNLIMLSPFSLFLPILFKIQRKWYVFLPTLLLISCLIEALQFLAMSGSCDVDDVILNVTGALPFFFVFQNKKVRKFLLQLAQPLKNEGS